MWNWIIHFVVRRDLRVTQIITCEVAASEVNRIWNAYFLHMKWTVLICLTLSTPGAAFEPPHLFGNWKHIVKLRCSNRSLFQLYGISVLELLQSRNTWPGFDRTPVTSLSVTEGGRASCMSFHGPVASWMSVSFYDWAILCWFRDRFKKNKKRKEKKKPQQGGWKDGAGQVEPATRFAEQISQASAAGQISL